MSINSYLIVSFCSIFLAMGTCGYFYITAGKSGLEGAAWILAILGAPTTLLSWIPFKLGLSKGLIKDFLWIIFFYLLQYQIIGLLIWKRKAK